MTTQTIPLHQQLRELRDHHGLLQQDIGNAVGARALTVSHWDRGVSSPSILHVIGYAAAVHHPVGVYRNTTLICQLQDLLPHLSTVRRANGFTRKAVARAMNVGVYSLRGMERSVAQQRRVRWSTFEPYLPAIGYHIQLMPTIQLEQAA